MNLLLKNKKILTYLVLYTIFIFLSGIFIGKSFLDDTGRHWKKYGNHRYERITEKFSKSLSLNSKQETQFKVIIDRHKVSIREVRKEFKVKFKELKDKKISEINDILTPEQQNKFELLRKKYQKKNHKKQLRHSK